MSFELEQYNFFSIKRKYHHLDSGLFSSDKATIDKLLLN